MDEFKIDQLTKELVAAELNRMEDPCATTANLVKQTLAVALNGLQPGGAGPEKIIEDACRGGITGLMLAQHNIGKGAVLILGAVSELAGQYNLDPTQLLRSALRGIADLRRFLGPEDLHLLQHQIECHFMGAGEYFSVLLQEPFSAPPAKTPAR